MTGELAIWHNHRGRGFERRAGVVTDAGDPSAITAGDLDGDGLSDLIIGHELHHGRGSGVEVRRQLTDGGFDAPTSGDGKYLSSK